MDLKTLGFGSYGSYYGVTFVLPGANFSEVFGGSERPFAPGGNLIGF